MCLTRGYHLFHKECKALPFLICYLYLWRCINKTWIQRDSRIYASWASIEERKSVQSHMISVTLFHAFSAQSEIICLPFITFYPALFYCFQFIYRFNIFHLFIYINWVKIFQGFILFTDSNIFLLTLKKTREHLCGTWHACHFLAVSTKSRLSLETEELDISV